MSPRSRIIRRCSSQDLRTLLSQRLAHGSEEVAVAPWCATSGVGSAHLHTVRQIFFAELTSAVAMAERPAVVDDVSVDDGHHRADLLDVLVLDAEVVVAQHGQVGELARLDA